MVKVNIICQLCLSIIDKVYRTLRLEPVIEHLTSDQRVSSAVIMDEGLTSHYRTYTCITAPSEPFPSGGSETRILDQNSKQIPIILQSFLLSAGLDYTPSQ